MKTSKGKVGRTPLREGNFLSWRSEVCYSIEIHAQETIILLLIFSGHCGATSATLSQTRAPTLGTEVCYIVNREHWILLRASSECLNLIKLVFS